MKFEINNRKNQKIVVLLEKVENQKGLVFVMHGLGGFKEQLHIQAFAEAFLEEGFTVVRFDTTNTFGESEGNYENATTTNYYEDLEDVIKWASSQEWYEEHFWLIGHSLGGISTALYAENYPEKVVAVAPISTVVSGKLTLETDREEIKNWKETGWRITESKSKQGLIKRLPWSHMEDRIKYNLLLRADKLMMPVLLIVGSEDDTTLLKHQQILFDKLPGEKEMHVIEGAGHTFREKEHLETIKHILKHWIEKINKKE